MKWRVLAPIVFLCAVAVGRDATSIHAAGRRRYRAKRGRHDFGRRSADDRLGERAGGRRASWSREPKDPDARRGSVGAGAGDRRRHDRSRHRAGASAWGRCPRERAELSCRRRTLALRATRHPGARPPDRRSHGGLQRARPGSIPSHRRGVPARRPGHQCVAGRSGLGAGVPAVFAGVCERGGIGEGGTQGHMARRVRAALGLAGGVCACVRPVRALAGTRGSRLATAPADAASRGTSVVMAHASTMSPVAATTNAPGSVHQRANAGSVPKPRPGRRDGADRGGDFPGRGVTWPVEGTGLA